MWTIFKKEMIDFIISIRFVVTLVIILSVFAMSGIVFTGKYKQDIDIFSKETNTNLNTLQDAAKSMWNIPYVVQTVHNQPKLTQLFCPMWLFGVT